MNEIEGEGSENERALEGRDSKLSGGERGGRGGRAKEREREDKWYVERGCRRDTAEKGEE